ncbi:MAG: tetratricopeptide repeat protein, partial [Bacteroidetes bacterium]|nr:tetratricopeptide repeat protein [Bacteroidota bacterium]
MKELRIIFFFLVVIFLFSCDEEGKKKNDAGTNSLVAIKYPLPQNTDSLIALLKTLPGDTNKVNALNALCWQMKNGDPDTALVVGNDALNLAVKLKWENGQADALGNIGVCYRNKGDHPKSLDYFIRSLKIFEKENDGLGIAARLGSIGTVYFSEEDFPKAKEWFLKALRKSQELNDKSKIAAQLGNIGNVYFKEGQYIEAIDYDNRALNIFREIKSKKEVELNLSNIGINYSFMAKEKNDPAERDTLRRKAMQYYSQAYQLSLQMHSKRRQAKNLGMIGSLYGEEYNFKPAYDYVYKALTLSDSIGAKDYVKDWYEGLSTLYEESTIPLPDSIGGKLLNMEQMRLRSLHYFKSYVNLRDTLFSQENKKQLVQKEMNYEFDKKQE